MFIRYDDKSLRMVTGVEAPESIRQMGGDHIWGGWSVIVSVDGQRTMETFKESEKAAWRFFHLVSKWMVTNRVFTETGWIELKAIARGQQEDER